MCHAGERSPSKLPSFLRASRVNMLRHYKIEEDPRLRR
jgi:hypothetical protein